MNVGTMKINGQESRSSARLGKWNSCWRWPCCGARAVSVVEGLWPRNVAAWTPYDGPGRSTEAIGWPAGRALLQCRL